MKNICRVSGVSIASSTAFNNLGLRPADSIVLSVAPIFKMSVGKILKIARLREPSRFTPEQRHLLTLALLHSTGLIHQDFPLFATSKLDLFYQLHMEAVINHAERIARNRDRWDLMCCDLPTLRISKENHHEVANTLPAFVKDFIFAPCKVFWEEERIALKKMQQENREKRLLDDEIFFEQELKAIITDTAANRNSKYTPRKGKRILSLLYEEMGEDAMGITKTQATDFLNILVQEHKNVNCADSSIDTLRRLITTFIKVGIDDSSTKLRAEVALVVAYIDSLKSFRNSINSLFGYTITKQKADLPSTYPTTYTVTATGELDIDKVLGSRSGLHQPKNPNVEKSTNPLVQKLLAKRKQQELLADANTLTTINPATLDTTTQEGGIANVDAIK